jgi:hypothetical protein
MLQRCPEEQQARQSAVFRLPRQQAWAAPPGCDACEAAVAATLCAQSQTPAAKPEKGSQAAAIQIRASEVRWRKQCMTVAAKSRETRRLVLSYQ